MHGESTSRPSPLPNEDGWMWSAMVIPPTNGMDRGVAWQAEAMEHLLRHGPEWDGRPPPG